MIEIVRATEQEEILMRCFGVCVIEYALIGAGIEQASLSGKGKLAHERQRPASGCETLPAFGATAID